LCCCLAGIVACATAANVVDGCLVLHHAALALKFLVEAEHWALRAGKVDVAGTAAACSVVGVGLFRVECGARSWAGGFLCGCYNLGVDVGDVASAATAGVDVVGGRDRWVWLGDAVG